MPDAWPAICLEPAIRPAAGTGNGSHVGTDHEQLAVRAQAAEQRRHRAGVGDRRQDQVDAAELGQLPRRDRRRSSRCSDGRRARGRAAPCRCRGRRPPSRSRAGGELDAEVAEAADAEHRDAAAGGRAAVRSALKVVMPGAQQRRGVLDVRQLVGNQRQRRASHDDVVGVAAVDRDPRDHRCSRSRSASRGGTTRSSRSCRRTSRRRPAGRPPALDPLAERGDLAGDLVAGDQRVRRPRVAALLRDRVAVADAAGVDPDERLARDRAPGSHAAPIRSRRRAPTPLPLACVAIWPVL